MRMTLVTLETSVTNSNFFHGVVPTILALAASYVAGRVLHDKVRAMAADHAAIQQACDIGMPQAAESAARCRATTSAAT